MYKNYVSCFWNVWEKIVFIRYHIVWNQRRKRRKEWQKAILVLNPRYLNYRWNQSLFIWICKVLKRGEQITDKSNTKTWKFESQKTAEHFSSCTLPKNMQLFERNFFLKCIKEGVSELTPILSILNNTLTQDREPTPKKKHHIGTSKNTMRR